MLDYRPMERELRGADALPGGGSAGCLSLAIGGSGSLYWGSRISGRGRWVLASVRRRWGLPDIWTRSLGAWLRGLTDIWTAWFGAWSRGSRISGQLGLVIRLWSSRISGLDFQRTTGLGWRLRRGRGRDIGFGAWLAIGRWEVKLRRREVIVSIFALLWFCCALLCSLGLLPPCSPRSWFTAVSLCRGSRFARSWSAEISVDGRLALPTA
jgi:hypothetical protein